MTAPQLSYVPSPHEQPYYEGLFQSADVARGGNIGGGEAVAFFTRSKLTIETLKSIWTLADTGPTTTTLDRRKFAIAIRLIQLAQNGVKAQGATLGGPPGMRPAMFEGVSGATLQLPPPEPTAGGPPPQQPPPQQQYAQPPQQLSPQQQPQYAQQPQQPQQQQRSPQQQYAQSTQQPSPQQISPARASTPTFQQQQYSAPPTPTRPPVAAGPAPVMSMAITPQDPYTMSPQEQARYESIFPNYAQNGFVGGKEAVELFSKSGVQPDALGKIWNLVDTPVDNQLDKLEFAMAMHLIVCISKKGLPIPTSLPISMKSLKSQQAPAAAPDAGFAMPAMETDPPPVVGGPPSIMSAASSIGGGSFGGGEPQHQFNAPPQQQFSNPPPLTQQGGGSVSISDAFEGLDAPASPKGYDQYGGPPPLPPQQQIYGGAQAAVLAVDTIPEPQQMSVPEPQQAVIPEPAPIPALSSMSPPKSTQQLASSYAMSDDASELAKLKTTLQKLQAENIALKAQMGSMTQDERDVHKEMTATVAEIGRLSTELSETRAQVLSSKTRLLESTAELAGAREKKSVMTDLIVETKATNDALQAAEHDINDAISVRSHAAPVPEPAPVAEADLFGGWGMAASQAAPPAPWGAPDAEAPAPWGAPVVETPSYDDDDDGIPYGAEAPAAYDTPALAAPTQQFAQQLSVSSSHDNAPEVYAPAPAAVQAATSYAPPSLTTAASRDNIDQMKKSAMAAEQTSRDAEDTYRAISTEAEKLKQVADASEVEARAKHERADKKRGMGKKKLAKEAEQSAIEAAEKKRHFLELQAQASNAQSLAAQSRIEADKMRRQAEQAEMDFASAESTRDSQSQTTQPAAAPAPSYGNSMQASNGGGMPDPSQISQQSYPSYGSDPYQAAPAFNSGSAFENGTPAPQNQQSDDSFGFGGGMIMGGGQGAISIPTPLANADYNNPF